MDLLLIFYFILFIAILIAPFAFLAWKYKDDSVSPFGESDREDLVNLREEKIILLSNLADLKAEEETGKMKSGEFRSLSQDLLVELERIDTEIESIQSSPSITSSPTSVSTLDQNISQASRSNQSTGTTPVRFCPECGTERLNNAKFCHNCGTKLD